MPVDSEQQLPWPSYHEYFSVLKTTAANIAVLCSISRKQYSTSETSSSNLRKHLEKKKHPTALKEFDSKKRKAEHGPTVADKRHAGGSSTQTLVSCLAATTSRPKALSQSRLDRLIVNFVVSDMQCFSVVENEQFRCLINALHPSATVMNRKSLANQIDILYREQKASLITTLEKASTVCCRADCWTTVKQVRLLV
ncbi:hypothetical protein MRX96_041750 [Rhipicephalus microplus]